ncbi:LOW QUALITY PROTEIN: hypothetical protein PHMEG_00018014 [Phytophthora megakarya]|uniref:Uncharacterized protein n=1 Tax=Phytophthora megakarya TaxID=4795 RepID=A0A225VWM3_9STRA|nr:LOW QUALITY PROTEIN: hypothetical protein PHMEG_00018014 [Phytophthora megakarya]
METPIDTFQAVLYEARRDVASRPPTDAPLIDRRCTERQSEELNAVPNYPALAQSNALDVASDLEVGRRGPPRPFLTFVIVLHNLLPDMFDLFDPEARDHHADTDHDRYVDAVLTQCLDRLVRRKETLE